MSTEDNPNEVSEQTAKYLRQREKKAILSKPIPELEQRKAKEKGKKQEPLPPVTAPPQALRPATSPWSHKAFVWEKLATTLINLYLQLLEEAPQPSF